MSRPSRRSLWTAKILGQPEPMAWSGKKAAPLRDPASRPFRGIILGIDPSLRGTGLALLEIGNDSSKLLHSHTLKLKAKMPFVACLIEIDKAVREFLGKASVSHVAIEQTIFVQNFQIAQILGAVRGAAIVAAASKGAEVFEYAPLRIKQAVVGFGRAGKEQVARTVANHLNLRTALTSDEADAAAAALCHAFTWRGQV